MRTDGATFGRLVREHSVNDTRERDVLDKLWRTCWFISLAACYIRACVCVCKMLRRTSRSAFQRRRWGQTRNRMSAFEAHREASGQWEARARKSNDASPFRSLNERGATGFRNPCQRLMPAGDSCQSMSASLRPLRDLIDVLLVFTNTLRGGFKGRRTVFQNPSGAFFYFFFYFLREK